MRGKRRPARIRDSGGAAAERCPGERGLAIETGGLSGFLNHGQSSLHDTVQLRCVRSRETSAQRLAYTMLVDQTSTAAEAACV